MKPGLLLLLVSFLLLSSCSLAPDYSDSDLAAGVSVSELSDYYLIEPDSGAVDSKLLIFYPGGLVDETAYLPVLTMIAAEGISIVLVKMPFDLAVFKQNAALDVIEDFPGRDYWIAGHSLGGAMASGVVFRNPELFTGIAFWASYPSADWDLSGNTVIDVLSLRGSLDGVAAPEEIEDADYLLPEGFTTIVIEGGNHSGFGSYGPQNGDNVASITKEEQHLQITEAMITFLGE